MDVYIFVLCMDWSLHFYSKKSQWHPPSFLHFLVKDGHSSHDTIDVVHEACVGGLHLVTSSVLTLQPCYTTFGWIVFKSFREPFVSIKMYGCSKIRREALEKKCWHLKPLRHCYLLSQCRTSKLASTRHTSMNLSSYKFGHGWEHGPFNYLHQSWRWDLGLICGCDLN